MITGMFKDGASTDAELKEALQGKTLKVYLTLLDSSEPIGAREMQRRLNYSSVNVAVHHLDKLCKVGLAAKDEHGRYFATKKVNIGIMDLFMNLGRIRFPRLLFYAAFFAAFSIMYFTTAPIVIGRDSAFVIVLAVVGTILFAYEAFKVWQQLS
ncbi:MAG TPA: hypothetical protein VNI77_02930 [Nitrososphaera sp.]|nr:hypothetical protein [Nitrososphaera sp.]